MPTRSSLRKKRQSGLSASARHGVRPSGETVIAFGEYDFYGDTTSRVVARYPGAREIILRNAGHVTWIQNPEAFQEMQAVP